MRLTFDHRVLDGATAAQALADLEDILLDEIVRECTLAIGNDRRADRLLSNNRPCLQLFQKSTECDSGDVVCGTNSEATLASGSMVHKHA